MYIYIYTYIYIIGDHTTQIYWNWTKKRGRKDPVIFTNHEFMVYVFVAVAQMMHRSSGDKARGSLKILQGGETKGSIGENSGEANGGQDNEASGRKNELSIVPICFECCYHNYHIRFPNSTPHTPEVDSMKRMKHEKPTIGEILKFCCEVKSESKTSKRPSFSGTGCF